MFVRARYKTYGAHVHIKVYIGPNQDSTLALAGTLTVTTDEMACFKVDGINASLNIDEWIEDD